MNDETVKDLLRRLDEVEHKMVRYRQGVVTTASPLAVAMGGSSIPYTNMQAVGGISLNVGDSVSTLMFGHDALVLGQTDRQIQYATNGHTLTTTVPLASYNIPLTRAWTTAHILFFAWVHAPASNWNFAVKSCAPNGLTQGVAVIEQTFAGQTLQMSWMSMGY